LTPSWKLAAAYVAALLVAFASERLVPAWSGALIAAAFLYLPFWLTPRGEDPARRWGLTLEGWRHSLQVGFLWCTIVFPLFTVGFSGFQQVVLHHRLVLDGARLAKPGLGWWLEFSLWQLAMIALSEELFFRGFLQTELNARWKARWRLLGADVGWAWPVTAALFAIGHLATTPHPARLLVFFPGLLMGWLRERTGGLLAPIVFHGLANLLMELLVRLHAA
jgi:membrane protease YdiL (CAAX protease family)